MTTLLLVSYSGDDVYLLSSSLNNHEENINNEAKDMSNKIIEFMIILADKMLTDSPDEINVVFQIKDDKLNVCLFCPLWLNYLFLIFSLGLK